MILLLVPSLLAGVTPALQSEQPLHRLKCTPYVSSLAFSPDSKLLAVACGDGTVLLGEAERGKFAVFAKHPFNVISVAFSPDGTTLGCSCVDGTITFRHVPTGKETRMIPIRSDRNPHDCARAIAFSPDGRILAWGESGNGKIRLWDIATRKLLPDRIRGHYYPKSPDVSVTSIAFSPTGRLLASSSYDETARLWEVATGKELYSFKVKNKPVDVVRAKGAAFSPDGWLMAAAIGPGPHVPVWNVATGKEVYALGTAGSSSLAFMSGGGILASGHFKALRLWDVASGKQTSIPDAHSDSIHVMAASADGRLLASGSLDKTVALWRFPRAARKEALRPPLTSVDKIDDQISRLSHADPSKAYEALWLLAGSERTVACLKVRLDELRVRFRMLDLRVSELLTQLNADQFAVREKAARELQTMQSVAEPFLRDALARGLSLEVRQRVEKILDQPTAPTTEAVFWVRSLEVLELIATEQARKLLTELADTVPEPFAREARLSLRRFTLRDQTPARMGRAAK